MLGGFKNEKKLLATLRKWSELKATQRLIHSVNYQYANTSELFLTKAENVFSRWDIISTSLVDTKKLCNQWHDVGWGEKKRLTGIFFELAFVLEVEPQNILGTHALDVWFPNHAGINEGNTWALADAVFSGRGKPGGQQRWPATKGYSYNKIMSPTDVLIKSKKNHHNEILVIGRPNVRTYPGLPATSLVKVKEIIFAPQFKGNSVSDYTHKKKIFNDQILKVNPGVKFTII